MIRPAHAALAAIAAAIAVLAAAPPAEAGRAGFRLWPQEECDTPRIVRTVTKRFNWAQRTTFHSDTRIVEMLAPHEYARREKHPTFHDRRYCKATAIMADGRKNAVYYLLSDDRYPPLQSGLEFCVMGYDYFRAYAPGCKQLRPQ